MATPTRNSDGRLRIPRAYVVSLQLAEGSEHYTQLERILTQFENYCTVTQSVRDGIGWGDGQDAHGRTLLGDKATKPAPEGAQRPRPAHPTPEAVARSRGRARCNALGSPPACRRRGPFPRPAGTT